MRDLLVDMKSYGHISCSEMFPHVSIRCKTKAPWTDGKPKVDDRTWDIESYMKTGSTVFGERMPLWLL